MPPPCPAPPAFRQNAARPPGLRSGLGHGSDREASSQLCRAGSRASQIWAPPPWLGPGAVRLGERCPLCFPRLAASFLFGTVPAGEAAENRRGHLLASLVRKRRGNNNFFERVV